MGGGEAAHVRLAGFCNSDEAEKAIRRLVVRGTRARQEDEGTSMAVDGKEHIAVMG